MDRLWPLWANHKKAILAVSALIVLLVSSPTLARWSDRVVLPVLAENNIFGLTSDLAGRTGEMVDDTRQLEGEVIEAEQAMGGLDRQNSLLKQQIQTNTSIQSELDDQLSGNIEARERMEAILKRERKTLALSSRAADKGGTVTEQMVQTVSNLGAVAENTGWVGNTTARLNKRTDVLLSELDKSVDNFRSVALLTHSLRSVENLLGLDAPLPRDKNSANPPLDEKLKNTTGNLLNENPKPEDSKKTGRKENKKAGDGIVEPLLPTLP
ncbi:hypothetical protein [Salinithrix halophila]|uniref:Uncharacterized protein n=1 Tax=Salinithrix halophila TaxID=1485204 RepID=A0ABV8JGK7_9BACL